MSAQPTMATVPLAVTQSSMLHFREPERVREDRIRRRAGAAWARLSASGRAIARTLRLSAASVSHRKAGDGPFANALLEVDRLERGGIDTSSLLEAWLSVAMDARAAFVGSRDAVARQLAHAEQIEDGAEDCEQLAWFDKQPGAGERWLAAIDRYLARLLPLRRALAHEVEHG